MGSRYLLTAIPKLCAISYTIQYHWYEYNNTVLSIKLHYD